MGKWESHCSGFPSTCKENYSLTSALRDLLRETEIPLYKGTRTILSRTTPCFFRRATNWTIWFWFSPGITFSLTSLRLGMLKWIGLFKSSSDKLSCKMRNKIVKTTANVIWIGHIVYWKCKSSVRYLHHHLSCRGDQGSLSQDWGKVQAMQPCQEDHIGYTQFVALSVWDCAEENLWEYHPWRQAFWIIIMQGKQP